MGQLPHDALMHNNYTALAQALRPGCEFNMCFATVAFKMAPQPQGQDRKEFVHPDAQHAKKKKTSPYGIQPISAFYFFLVANLVSAVYAPIQDCDETFNYWEPTHYISHGYGLQTWEYSPDFAIRSWFYIGLHAVVSNIRRVLPQSTKLGEFYFVRYVFAFFCALCQTLLFTTVSATLNPRIGIFYMMALVFSPGNFHSSTAFLPSSLAMYFAMLGACAFMNWRTGIKTSQGMYWFAAAGIFGWPFAAALCAPFLVEEGIIALISGKDGFIHAFIRVGRGVVVASIMMALDTAVNAFFYKKFEVVPWNIVKYNIFSSSGGPNLYGTEPWTFYFKNLALNFNIWFILALLALPLFLLQKAVAPSQVGVSSAMRTVVIVSPFYMWLGIFTMQPHKEERFMYPAYPFLAINAGISMHILLVAFGTTDHKTLLGKIPAKLRLLVVTAILSFSVNIGLARVYGIYSAYSAPMSLYSPLGAGQPGEVGLGGVGDNVCFGKDWYRFPNSYFLPRNMHAKFIPSEFRGLLPGEFSEARNGFGFWSGTWLPTSGLNDRNEENTAQYVNIRECNFLVDTHYPLHTDSSLPREPAYIADEERWETVKCVPFLDAANTSILARILYVPDLDIVPAKFRRQWGSHCLLKQKPQLEERKIKNGK
ncbi:glycosyltransferase family 22 protein [Zalerion maritima]|uniref:Mannosyltransferase n=1 Tax=Zalerion maritima TaxID=339359 RepID=A0AAD5RXC3_9PEZI|nr:glycosyltransferase family 22 protein [Zalerion maritima]